MFSRLFTRHIHTRWAGVDLLSRIGGIGAMAACALYGCLVFTTPEALYNVSASVWQRKACLLAASAGWLVSIAGQRKARGFREFMSHACKEKFPAEPREENIFKIVGK